MYDVGRDEIRGLAAWANTGELANTVIYSRDWQDRDAAANAIVALDMGADVRQQVADRLVAALRRDGMVGLDEEGRKSAVALLGRLGAPSVLGPLVEALAEAGLRPYAAEALGELDITEHLPEAAVSALVAAIGDRDAEVRKAAVRSLGRLCDRTVPAAGAVGARHAVPLLECGEATVRMLAEACGDADEGVRVAAAAALGAYGARGTCVETVLAALMTGLGDGAAQVRQAAAEAGARCSGAGRAGLLLAALKDREERVRRAAAGPLKEVAADTPEVMDTLTARLSDADALARALAAWSLGELGEGSGRPDARAGAVVVSEEAFGLLLRLLDDPEMRGSAISALGRIGDRRAFEPLLCALGDRERSVRQLAAGALGAMGDGRATAALVATLRDEDYIVRGAAAEALGSIAAGGEGAAACLRPLGEALADPEGWVRQAAAVALGRIGDPVALPDLVTALQQGGPYERAAVIEALGEIGAGRPGVTLGTEVLPAIDALVAVLTARESSVYEGATTALARMDAGPLRGAATRALLQALTRGSAEQGHAAAEALGKIGGAGAPEGVVVEALVATLLAGEPADESSPAAQMARALTQRMGIEASAIRYGGPWVTRAVVRALGKLGDPRAIRPLISVLKEEDLELRWDAAEALREIGARGGESQVVAALIAALDDPSPRLRQQAAEELGTCGEARAIPPLTKALGDADADVRRCAARALWKAADPGTQDVLCAALRDTDYLVRWAAADALGAIGARSHSGSEAMHRAAVEALGTALAGDARKEVRQAAAEALRKSGDPRALQPLLAALGDAEQGVSLAAADALAAIAAGAGLGDADGAVGPALVAALQGADVRRRRGAAWGLWRIGAPWTVEPLVSALGDADRDVRREAARALGALVGGRPREQCAGDAYDHVLAALTAALKDKEDVVGRAAAQALGAMGDEQAIKPLISVLRGRALVRDSAAAALEALTGEHFGNDAVRWREWWRSDSSRERRG